MKTFKIICALLALASCGIVFAQESMPKPRAVSDQERAEVLRTLVARFGVPSREKVEVMAAGAFRFAGNAGLTYIERTDLGSSLLERASYGLTLAPIDEKANSREVLVPKLLDILRKVAPTAETPVFAGFQDEFAGTTPMKAGAPPVDPRKHSIHVARTVSFVREVEGVPVFGSELLAGLDRDGSVGRLRVHWPGLDPKQVREAQRLQKLVAGKVWQVPKEFANADTEILEVQAGVGHSAFADPGFRSAAVVRVLARRSAQGTQQPIASTTYTYFDGDGKEVVLTTFPTTPGNEDKTREGGLAR